MRIGIVLMPIRIRIGINMEIRMLIHNTAQYDDDVFHRGNDLFGQEDEIVLRTPGDGNARHWWVSGLPFRLWQLPVAPVVAENAPSDCRGA